MIILQHEVKMTVLRKATIRAAIENPILHANVQVDKGLQWRFSMYGCFCHKLPVVLTS